MGAVGPDDRAEFKEFARRIYEIWNERGPDGLAEEIWRPEVVFDEGDAFPDAVRSVSAEAARGRLAERQAHLGRMSIVLEDAELVAPGAGFAAVTVHVEGQGSGLAIDFPWWHAVRFEGGRVFAIWECQSEERARQALSEAS